MFCPKCATQNVEGASFCRACGANISLVPQALTGQLPVQHQPDIFMDRHSRRRARRNRKKEPTLDEAVRNMIMGVGFVVVAMLVNKYAPAGHIWWFWMLVPAFGLFGTGVSELIRCKQNKEVADSAEQPQLNSVRPANLAAPKTGELMSPPVTSVTEGTTRHLGAEAPTRHFDS